MSGNPKRILVCGGAGYIGSHVVRAILAAGDEAVIVDDLSTGHAESVPASVKLVRASIGDRAAMDAVFDQYRPGAVMHFCANAYVGESVSNPRKYYRNNVANGLGLLETMVDHDVRRLVFSSSCAVYGHPERLPLDETCRVSPISPYGRTKAMFENVLADFEHAYGLRSVCLRYFNAAGASADGAIGEDHEPETHLIPLALRQALLERRAELLAGRPEVLRVFGDDYATPDGTCVRDYIHVADLADAHLRAVDYLLAGERSAVVNLANQTGFSVLDVIEACRRETGCRIAFEMGPRRPGDPDQLVGSAARARQVLGWEARHSSIENIVRTAWQWHVAHPLGYRK